LDYVSDGIASFEFYDGDNVSPGLSVINQANYSGTMEETLKRSSFSPYIIKNKSLNKTSITYNLKISCNKDYKFAWLIVATVFIGAIVLICGIIFLVGILKKCKTNYKNRKTYDNLTSIRTLFPDEIELTDKINDKKHKESDKILETNILSYDSELMNVTL
jgi:hypothetical protein